MPKHVASATSSFSLARLAASLALAAGLAGCAAREAPLAGGVATPARFESGGSPRAPQTSRWWRSFGSPELDRLMRTAEADSPDLAAAMARLAQAQAQARVAGSSLFPTLDAGADASRSRGSGTTGSTTVRTQGRNSFDATLGASYLVDLWGSNRDALEAAIRDATASAYQLEVARIGLQASLVEAWLTLAAGRERGRVAQENLRAAERVLRVYRARRDAGTASDLEIAQQTTLVENQRASIPSLRQSAEQARVTLALLSGHTLQETKIAAASVTRLRAAAPSSGLPSALLARRPDVRAAEESLRAAEADVSVARKAMLPQIQLTGRLGLASSDLGRLLRPESVLYSLAAGLAQPIFDGGRLRSQAALSEARRQELLEAYRKAILSAFADVETALIAVRETGAREAGVARAATAARRAFALTEERLGQGTIDLATMLEAQRTLFSAQDSLVQARLSRLQAIAALYQALGGDWSATQALDVPAQIGAEVSSPGFALPVPPPLAP